MMSLQQISKKYKVLIPYGGFNKMTKEANIDKYLKEGQTIYHCNRNQYPEFPITPVKFAEISLNKIRITHDIKIGGENKLSLPLTHFGEWLFFSKDDVKLSVPELSIKEEYLFFKNAEILKHLDKMKKEEEENTEKIKRKKAEQEKIKKVIEERKIKHLIHFTPIENIPSILNNQYIYTRDYLDKQNLAYIPTDYQRLDNQTNSISISISYPSVQMLISKIYDHFRIAIIFLDPKLLYETTDKKYFYKYNAASNLAKKSFYHINPEEGPGFVKRKTSIEELFFNKQEITQAPNKISRPNNMPPEYTTNPQAEILFYGNIDTKYINKIHVHPNDYNYIEELFAKNVLDPKLSHKILSDQSMYDFDNAVKIWPHLKN